MKNSWWRRQPKKLTTRRREPVPSPSLPKVERAPGFWRSFGAPFLGSLAFFLASVFGIVYGWADLLSVAGPFYFITCGLCIVISVTYAVYCVLQHRAFSALASQDPPSEER